VAYPGILRVLRAEIKSQASQYLTQHCKKFNITTSTTTRIAVLPWALGPMLRRRAPLTRYTLQHNTTSKIKGLIWNQRCHFKLVTTSILKILKQTEQLRISAYNQFLTILLNIPSLSCGLFCQLPRFHVSFWLRLFLVDVSYNAANVRNGKCLHVACLHDQNKNGFFGGPAFIQPIRAT